MRKLIDAASGLLYLSVSTVLLRHPTRTVLGVMLGLVCSLLATLFAPLLRGVPHTDFEHIALCHWIGLGFFLMYWRLAWAYLAKRPGLSEEIQEVLDLIEKGNLSNAEKRRLYRAAIERLTAELASSAVFFANTRKINILTAAPEKPDLD